MIYIQAAVYSLAVTAGICIFAEIRRIKKIIYIFKPLSTLIIIAVAAAGILDGGKFPGEAAGITGLLIIAALLFSLGGDVVLMPPDSPKRFRIGLILFFLAHILYIAAFWPLGSWQRIDLVIALVLLVIGGGYYRLLLPKLGRMKIPVALYVLVISLMVSRALSVTTAGTVPKSRAGLIAAGAVLFFFSDIILSANRFWKPWRFERISLAFYFSGQLCLALAAGS